MKNNLFEYVINTSREEEFIDISPLINKSLRKTNVKEGLALIYCPHTTAAITINENADPDVVKDIINSLDKAYPINDNYKHLEGNSHAHIKSSLMGAQKSIIITEGNLLLGTWQGVYFCEFDGPRKRKVYIKIMNI